MWVDEKLGIAAHGRMWCIYVPYVHNPEGTCKILQTQIKKEMVVLETRHGYARFINDDETTAVLDSKGKKLYSPVTCVFNSCQ